jgi:hypothetical protein
MLGEDGAICEACESPHHAECWDKDNGCGQPDCINAPLRQDLDTSVLEKELATNEMQCPHCRKLLPATAVICSGCQRITTPSGVYEGPQKLAPEVQGAFMLGIASLVVPLILNLIFSSGTNKPTLGSAVPLIIGINCGLSALKKAGTAKLNISKDPSLKGRGLAIAAQILGGLGVGFQVLGFLFLFLVLFFG